VDEKQNSLKKLQKRFDDLQNLINLPIFGIESELSGIMPVIICENIIIESSTVTSEFFYKKLNMSLQELEQSGKKIKQPLT
jgi:hypothetical protein